MEERRGSVRAALIAACGVLVVANVMAKYGPQNSTLVMGPVVIVAMILLGRWGGLSLEGMGLGRRHLRRGAIYAAVAVVAVAAVYLAAAALPATRDAFDDQRYQVPLPEAVVKALVVIPIATVLPEEVAFRGVLWGLLASRHRAVVATAVSSILFGLWHILPSLRMGTVNAAVDEATGAGLPWTLLVVAGAVLFTALAGVLLCELRRRSGSLLAPIGLHWATNGLGVLMTAILADAF
jgi:membrane protease YdiL (CAAX protease family)